ncbi:MAG TPA: RagB/SusD family nutrient uptake outer membrane protein [Candidatus Bacteroides avicola]|uniref:RagB/SusD family nutrient uptake outer membrane protein n=1 Tax=Candidatus Bacteroides avicola TaxID=2838468 RepID=A0A9D2HY61_9BACE|nr:RagB/SusD family nutrient uptake outer membrane protein [Candidatus Bacteroides avicola]
MKKNILGAFLALTIGLTGCEDFLNKTPLDELTESTAFNTYDNFKTYSWKLYEYFDGFPTDGGYTPANISSEYNSDNMINAQSGGESAYAYQLKSVPSTSSSWNFSYIRNVNLMLQNIDKSSMDEDSKNHWRSVGYFFRALRYFDMMVAYGDVPWIDKVLTDTDTDILMGKRTPRDEVARHILEDLQYAEANIKPDGDGSNTINTDVVRALISRFGLYEGTWRKYHEIGGEEVYLRASADASAKLIESFPNLMESYDDVFNSEELVGQPGIILAKQYATSLVTHSITRVIRSSSWYADLTKDAVDSYLCTDGRPIKTSTVYEGDQDIYSQFRNRDRRLYFTVIPPYRVELTGPQATSFTWEYTDDPRDREYIDFMATLTPETGKRLPVSNYVGYNVHAVPHFRNYPNGQGFLVSQLGFYFWKYYNRQVDNMNLRTSTIDYPIFRMGEVLVNYAEAKYELNEFDQSVADASINKLRVRANLPGMVVSEITDAFDPDRDPTVPAVLWEIRRERRVELMGDGFRFRDLKRWKKGEYLNKQPLGMWVNNADYDNKLIIHGGSQEGYVEFFAEPLGWLDYYYLEPLPTQELALNPNLEQNPGWE